MVLKEIFLNIEMMQILSLSSFINTFIIRNAWCIMSNHVHLVLYQWSKPELLIADLKRFTSQSYCKAYRKIQEKADFLLDFF
jgi:REP element-mobilizing transposase RayT